MMALLRQCIRPALEDQKACLLVPMRCVLGISLRCVSSQATASSDVSKPYIFQNAVLSHSALAQPRLTLWLSKQPLKLKVTLGDFDNLKARINLGIGINIHRFVSMELNVKIGFNELLSAIKSLPDSQLTLLKKELDKPATLAVQPNRALKELLLKGPVFEKEQLASIAETRKSINQWRNP